MTSSKRVTLSTIYNQIYPPIKNSIGIAPDLNHTIDCEEGALEFKWILRSIKSLWIGGEILPRCCQKRNGSYFGRIWFDPLAIE
ncbi:hypothetical protein P872_06950 [Rhodonellum psychrophilum GCM71 = DSM 17998]|uniref:Uncharacterized protein n=2 Tax=Rhodonellum TaxID=336827 RepID=U5BVJ3_9BACT|nr:hypothetical protein P872_06950 [Rhodonellum psychrophilum GCM71 = DSM 17998]SDY67418.1 hypothetical protein SAMN05444412_102190 [Rhodonellum ikkaensis]